MAKTVNETEIIIKDILSEQLALDSEDIRNEDRLIDDLNMNEEDLTDFTDNLAAAGFDMTEIDFEEVETLGELVDKLSEVVEI